MADYETIQRNRNITVGIFVVIAVCALVWLIYKFGDLPGEISKLNSFQVFVQFPSANGVQRDTPVRFCGYQIGRVVEVMYPQRLKDQLTGEIYHQTKVVLSIDKKYKNIPSNSEVKVMTRGLGSSYIEIKEDITKPATPIDPNKPETKYLTQGMNMQGSAGITSEFFPEQSQKKLEELVDSMTALINNANDIIGDKDNQDNLKSTLANLSLATAQAEKTLAEIQTFASKGSSILNSAEGQINDTVKAVVDLSEEFGKTAAELRAILHKVNNGDGSVGRLLNDGKFYESLLESSDQLNLLLQELKAFTAKSSENGIPLKLK